MAAFLFVSATSFSEYPRSSNKALIRTALLFSLLSGFVKVMHGATLAVWAKNGVQIAYGENW